MLRAGEVDLTLGWPVFEVDLTLGWTVLRAGEVDLTLCWTVLSAGEVDLTLADESFDIPKPLTVALRELGSFTDPVVQILVEAGADVDVEDYTGSPVRTDVFGGIVPAL